MRRLLALALTLALGGVLVLAATGGAQDSVEDGPSGGDYRVDAIFDTAKGIVPGQLVKVAGARVGEVSDVVLTPGYDARIQLKVDSRFAPFRRDARCEIQPEGLISENFVQCDPGSPSAPALEGRDGEAPTVPLERTAIPVNLTDLFEVWQVPVRDRLRVLLTSLGAGLAARGEDLNDILRRANPTLGLVRQAIETIDAQRDDLLAAIGDTRRVMRELGKQPERLQAFVEESSDVLSTTARRRAELREGVRRLPGLLAAAKPALRNLDALADAGTPLARRVRQVSPDVDRLFAELPGALRPALPALESLGRASVTGRRAVKSAGPVVKLLRLFAGSALPTGDELEKTLVNLRDRGFVEGLLSFTYFTVAATARYDAVSHMLPAHLQLSTCSIFAETPVEGCEATYNQTTPVAHKRSKGRRKAKAQRPAAPAPQAERPAAPLLQPRPGAPDAVQKLLPKVTAPVTDAVKGLLDALGLGGGDTPRGQNPLGGLLDPKRSDGKTPTDRLLDLLLGPSR